MKSFPDAAFRLPFDQFQRYHLLAIAAERFRNTGQKLRILDVGGYLQGGGQDAFTPASFFLPDDDELVIMDIKKQGPGRYVAGSGLAIPFRNQAFDIVVAMDTLEHIPGELRSVFVRELCRVADRGVMIAGPIDQPANILAEKILFSVIEKILEMPHPALKEHLQYGLPKISEIETWLAMESFQGIHFPDGFLPNWLFMMLLKHLFLQLRVEPETQEDLDYFYNTTLGMADRREPAYRQVFVALRQGTDIDLHPLLKSDSSETRNAVDLFGYQFTNLVMLKEVAQLNETLHQIFTTRPNRMELEQLAEERLHLIRDKEDLINQYLIMITERDKRRKAELLQKDLRIDELKEEIHRQHQTIQELLDFRNRIQSSIPYKLYKMIKK